MSVIKRVPHVITLARPVLTAVFVHNILRDDYTRAIPIFAAICLTDILDGVAARTLGACTRIGAYLDVAADLMYVMASLIVLNTEGEVY